MSKKQAVNEERDRFLGAYKRLEGAVHDRTGVTGLGWIKDGSDFDTVFDLEGNITDPQIAGRLKLCRAMRNYMQHDPDSDKGFAEATPAMTGFLEAIVRDLSGMDQAVKDIVQRNKPLKLDSTVAEAAKMLGARSKQARDIVPVVDEENKVLGCMTCRSVCSMIAKSMDLDSRLGENTGLLDTTIPSAMLEDPVTSLEPGTTYIVLDKKGKYRGLCATEQMA